MPGSGGLATSSHNLPSTQQQHKQFSINLNSVPSNKQINSPDSQKNDDNTNDDLAAAISKDMMADNCTSLASLPAEPTADNSLLNSEGKQLQGM